MNLGDRVRITGLVDDTSEDAQEYLDAIAGKEGTITFVPRTSDKLYDVQFDQPEGTSRYKSVVHHFYESEMELVT